MDEILKWKISCEIEKDKIVSYRNYSLSGSQYKKLIDKLIECVDYITELQKEIKELKNKKPITKIVYRGKGVI